MSTFLEVLYLLGSASKRVMTDKFKNIYQILHNNRHEEHGFRQFFHQKVIKEELDQNLLPCPV